MTGSREGLNLWINDQKRLFYITARFDIPKAVKHTRGWRIEISQILNKAEILRSVLKKEYQEAWPDKMPRPIMGKPEKGLRLFTGHDVHGLHVIAMSDVPEEMKQNGEWRIEPLELFGIAFEVEDQVRERYFGLDPSEIPKYRW